MPLQALLELIAEKWGDRVEMDYDRCRKCHADLQTDFAVGRTTCYKCGKPIKRWQIKRWQRHNRG